MINRNVFLVSVAIACAFTLSAWAEEPSAEEKRISFQQQVRPILSDKCFKCHGPDAESRKADLRLDRRDDAEYVLSPDEPSESELLRRILSKNADEQMPPPKSKLLLTKAEQEILQNWIRQGGDYQTHWSFRSLVQTDVPIVADGSWPKNEIDSFVLARLEREKLHPQAEADRERLIRRLSFDLIGLPPTIEEIDQFLSDDGANAYETLVDRLLSREEYGERLASEWLDVARYADTYGYQVDRDRFVWPWRDWVIKAFNENLPYDQFVTWQLAGDLLPNASDEQVMATTFNRLHSQKVEGGSVPEEFRVEYVADRTQTFATAFLGLTLECARCHDHKYDPLTQAEYYQIFAFFNNIDEAGLYSYFTPSVPTPTLRLTDKQQKDKIAELQAAVEREAEVLTRVADEVLQDGFVGWLKDKPRAPEIPGRVAYLDFENSAAGPNESVPGKVGKAVKLTGDDAIGLSVGNFRRFEPFSVALWLQTPNEKERAVVFHRSRAWTDAGSRGYELLIADGQLQFSLIHFWPGNAISVRTKEKIPLEQWQHVAVCYDGSSHAKGIKLLINGVVAECEVVRDNLYKNITGGGGDHIAIGERFRDRGFADGLVDEFQVFSRLLSPLEVRQIYDGESLATALRQDANDELTRELARYYLLNFSEQYQKQLAALQTARQQQAAFLDGLTEIMVMREMPEPRPTFVLKRGAYDAPRDRVLPGTPQALPPFPEDLPNNRLGLARWLTAADHPLLARVTVNRYWQMIFGNGLVRTTEDVGSQGAAPTHPELLDWLAKDFIDNGWNVKRLLKQMVMSATYRQQSSADSELLERDSDNLLLARAPVYRLSAEMIRDNALATSGLLVNKIGGPPAKPYEVAVSFKPVGRDKGAGLYRRSLYTYWKRTGPAPVMMTFNAAKREVCVVKRERTSSPLQAFVLLNDPQFVEAARMLAQKLLKQHNAEHVPAILSEMFRVLTSRRGSERELAIIKNLYEEQLAYFAGNPAAAKQLLQTGDATVDPQLPPAELAAISVVASMLMNFDHCVMKR